MDTLNTFSVSHRSFPAAPVSEIFVRQLGLSVEASPQNVMAALRASADSIVPPQEIHWVGRKSGLFFDIRGGDEIVNALAAAKFDLRTGGRYLDFGCSSGRTLRTMQTAYPGMKWHGVDPDPNTIAWAQNAMPAVAFAVSAQLPPLSYANGFFSGVYAISVWSHFRADVGIQWFSEMHRIIERGGFLLFTAPGFGKLAKQITEKPELLEKQRFLAKAVDLRREGHVFRGSFVKNGNRNLDTSFWGEALLTIDWVAENLLGDWSLRSLVPRGNRGQQDIYVLERL